MLFNDKLKSSLNSSIDYFKEHNINIHLEPMSNNVAQIFWRASHKAWAPYGGKQGKNTKIRKEVSEILYGDFYLSYNDDYKDLIEYLK